MSKNRSVLFAASLAVVAALSFAGCSASNGAEKPASPSASAPAEASTESSAPTDSNTGDTTTYATDAEGCSAVVAAMTDISSELTTAVSGDPTQAVAALGKLTSTMTNIAGQMKSPENKAALETLASYYQQYADALQTKDASKLSDLQTELTKTGNKVADASTQLGKCVVGQ
jgi:hypothetical protein